MNSKKYRILVIIVVAVVFFGSLYSHKYRVVQRNYADFHCFYIAGQRALIHQDIYVLKDRETSEFRYAPIFAVMMSGLAFFDEATADTIWFVLNFILLIAAFICLKNLVAPQGLDFKSAFWLYSLAILSIIRIIFHNFNCGQSNILMLASAAIGLYLISRKNEFAGGLIFAFSIMVKYTPLIFIPYFFFRRKIKLGIIIVASAAFYLALPALFIGPKTNFLYLKTLKNFLTHSTILEQPTILTDKNQSLISLVYRFIGPDCSAWFVESGPMPFQSWNIGNPGKKIVFLILCGILYILALYRPRKKSALQDNAFLDNIDYCLLFVCVILFNLNAWLHTFILLAPAYFVIVYYLLKCKFKDRTVLIPWLISLIINGFLTRSILGKTATHQLLFYSPFTINALIVFFILLRLKLGKKAHLLK
jgi:hypothetical protein